MIVTHWSLCVCLHSQDQGALASRGPGKSQPALGKHDLCVSEQSESGCSIAGSYLWVSECHQLGRLWPRGSYWADEVSPAAGGICTVHMCIYLFSLRDLHPAHPGRRAGWGLCLRSVFVFLLCPSVWSVWLGRYICTCGVCVCCVYLCLLGLRA